MNKECLCRKLKICRLFAVVAIVVAALTLAHCATAETKGPQPTVSIDFALDSGETFAAKVRSVDAGIFDGEGNYLRTERVENPGKGMQIALDPGDYRLVFWGNVGKSTKIDDIDNGGAGRVVHNDAIFDMAGMHVMREIDPLYYGPYGNTAAQWPGMSLSYLPLTVTGELQSRKVTLVHAFREFGFFVSGLPEGEFPVVELDGCPEALCYSGMMETGERQIQCCRTRSCQMNGIRYVVASFRTFRFNDDCNVDIVVRDAEHETELYRTSLADAVMRGSGGEQQTERTGFVLGFSDSGSDPDGNVRVDISIVPWNEKTMDVALRQVE